MIFALNIANTKISLGCIEDEQIVCRFLISADTNKTADEYSIIINQLLEFYKIDKRCINGVVISSVVPALSDTLSEAVTKLFLVKPITVGAGMKTGLNIKIENPAQLGHDLAVLAVGALAKYPSPLVIISMGTATAFTVIDNTNSLIGVSIAPGVGISLNALTSNSSLLPEVKINLPKNCIGTNTDDCLRSGSVFGTASMIDGMIDRIEEMLGYKVTAVATGNYAGLITSVCKHSITVDNDLIFNGLSIFYSKNKKK